MRWPAPAVVGTGPATWTRAGEVVGASAAAAEVGLGNGANLREGRPGRFPVFVTDLPVSFTAPSSGRAAIAYPSTAECGRPGAGALRAQERAFTSAVGATPKRSRKLRWKCDSALNPTA